MGLFLRGRPIVLRNARVVGPDGVMASSLRIEREAVAGFDVPPRPGDVVADMDGGFVFPGLINAHEHLEHNHFGLVGFRPRYANASDWADDVGPRLRSDPALIAGRSRPLPDQLFIGGLKNLLSGATTVAHHNPFYRQLKGSFPVRAIRQLGWAHSLYLQAGRAGGGPAGVVADRYRETPPAWPFVIHLAEGTDERARGELAELARLGALGPNTLLVHAVGIDAEGWREVARRGAGVVWCPASNVFLLGESIDGARFADPAGPPVALGTDSRLTGSRDLLDELRVAARSGPFRPIELARMVTTTAARLLRLRDAGRLAVGAPADLLVIPPLAPDPYEALLLTARGQVRLVMLDGRPRYGAPELAEVFAARGVSFRPVDVDGERRILDAALVRRLWSCSIPELGLRPLA